MYRLLAWLAAVLLAISSIKIQSDWFLNWFFFSASLTTVIAQIQYQNKETISETQMYTTIGVYVVIEIFIAMVMAD